MVLIDTDNVVGLCCHLKQMLALVTAAGYYLTASKISPGGSRDFVCREHFQPPDKDSTG